MRECRRPPGRGESREGPLPGVGTVLPVAGVAEVTPRWVLDPVDRVSEVLFGLIMVLGVTGSLSVAEAGRDDVHAMLVGALGCNLAWGLVDGIFYLMGCLAEKGRSLAIYEAVRAAADPQEARQCIADALPPMVASVLEPAELEAVHQRLRQRSEPPAHARLSREDWLGGVSVSLLVGASTVNQKYDYFRFFETIYRQVSQHGYLGVGLLHSNHTNVRPADAEAEAAGPSSPYGKYSERCVPQHPDLQQRAVRREGLRLVRDRRRIRVPPDAQQALADQHLFRRRLGQGRLARRVARRPGGLLSRRGLDPCRDRDQFDLPIHAYCHATEAIR